MTPLTATYKGDIEQLNLFNQFLKMANFLCTCSGIPEIKKPCSLTKHFVVTCLNRTRGAFSFFFFLSSRLCSNTCCKKKMGWGGLCRTQDTALAAHRTAYQYVPGQVELNAKGGERWGGKNGRQSVWSVLEIQQRSAVYIFKMQTFEN